MNPLLDMRRAMERLPTIILCLAVVSVASAQQHATTDEGRDVVLHDDGIWQYVDELLAEDTSRSRIPPAHDELSDCEFAREEAGSLPGHAVMFTKAQPVARNDHGGFLTLSLGRVDDALVVRAQYNKCLGCFSRHASALYQSRLSVETEAGEVAVLEHVGDTVCCDGQGMTALLEEEDLAVLLKSPIKTIRIRGTEYYADVEPFWGGERYFMEQYPCVAF